MVTGGSRGIGKAIAQMFGKEKQKVVVNYVSNSQAADEVAQQITQSGGEAITIKADLAKREEVDSLFSQAAEKFKGLDVLVNNAGITRDNLIMRMKPDDWQAVIDTNLTGPFFCAQAAAKVMSKQRQGRIINMSSVVARSGNIGQANYSAAKAGLIGMTKTFAKEYGSRKIISNAVCPGFIDSEMTAVLKEDIKKIILSEIPLGRMGTVEEVASLIRFLALDPAGAYINGQVLGIDGGLYM